MIMTLKDCIPLTDDDTVFIPNNTSLSLISTLIMGMQVVVNHFH